jgi:methyltransferase
VIGGPPPGWLATWGLASFLAVLAVQRGSELVVSARNERRLRVRGAREYGPGHFPLLVLIHVLFPVSLVAEVSVIGAGPGQLWPVWLGFWLAAQALRYAAVRALGQRWTVRIWVLPGMPLVRRGPYRFLRHPNYLAVVVELLAAPLLFGAWRTAVAISVLNLFALWIRIRAEEEALRGATAVPR